MSELCLVQWCQPQSRMFCDPAMRLRRVHVGKIQTDHYTGVRVGSQYRPRSLTTVSTAGKTLSPNIAFVLAAKSGHSTGASLGRSGTMRPITRSLRSEEHTS